MIKTYRVENEKNEVIEYFRLLNDAKQYCVRYYDKDLTILSIKGDYFGEGFHQYRLRLNANKLVFNKIWKK